MKLNMIRSMYGIDVSAFQAFRPVSVLPVAHATGRGCVGLPALNRSDDWRPGRQFHFANQHAFQALRAGTSSAGAVRLRSARCCRQGPEGRHTAMFVGHSLIDRSIIVSTSKCVGPPGLFPLPHSTGGSRHRLTMYRPSGPESH